MSHHQNAWQAAGWIPMLVPAADTITRAVISGANITTPADIFTQIFAD